MIAYLYRFKIKHDKIEQFIHAWSQLSEHLLEHKSLGSRLHKGEDGIFYAYAQWPDEHARALAFEEPLPAEAMRQFHDAILEREEVISLEPLSNYLLPVATSAKNKFFIHNLFDTTIAANLRGQYCFLSRTQSSHAEELFKAYQEGDESDWEYLPYGPFATLKDFSKWLDSMREKPDLELFSIIDEQRKDPCGIIAFSRIDRTNGVIEIAHVHFARCLRKSKASKEAILLMLRHVFETLKFRRCEWKCDALNHRSVRAALRFGFSYEGRFRNACIIKQQHRDTDWFSIICEEWPRVEKNLMKLINC